MRVCIDDICLCISSHAHSKCSQYLYFLYFYLFCPEGSLVILTLLEKSNNLSRELDCNFTVLGLEVTWEYTNKFRGILFYVPHSARIHAFDRGGKPTARVSSEKSTSLVLVCQVQ